MKGVRYCQRALTICFKFKIFHGVHNLVFKDFLDGQIQGVLVVSEFSLQKMYCGLDVTKYFFSQGVVKEWSVEACGDV